jgi:glycosyltransferase involved in cell wall biosynthesis
VEVPPQIKKNIIGDKEFVVFFNSRNIRRKSIPDLIWSYRIFIEKLSVEERKKCLLLLHTQPIDDNGTDLPKVVETLNNIEGFDVRFSPNKLSSEELNYLYNLADVTCLLTSNEGWGLTLTESMLAGTMILANTTGGMQDQMRFTDEKGEWYTPSLEVPSNNTGKYKKHGKWAIPVFPSSRSIQGSPPTPYIWDDRCDPMEVAEKLEQIYWMSKEERKQNGLEGRQWCLSEQAGFNTFAQAQRVIEALDELFETWSPREDYELFKVDGLPDNTTKHKLVY